MRNYLIWMSIAVILLAGCTKTEPVPLADAAMTLNVEALDPRAGNDTVTFNVTLTNQGPEAVKVDPLSLGGVGYEDTLDEYHMTGPNGTDSWQATQPRRGGGPYFGEDYPECQDLVEIGPGESSHVEVLVNLTDRSGKPLPQGESYQFEILYRCDCLKATWRGLLDASTEFTPSEWDQPSSRTT